MTQRLRKRSTRVALVLMVPATGLLLTACSPEPETPAVVYSSVQECQEKNPDANAKEQCLTDYQQAAALHPKVAPKYETLQECEADFGAQRCEIAPDRQPGYGYGYGSSGHSFFMPMMMGYMASQMFNRPQVMQPGSFSSAGTQPRDSVQPQPLYKSRDDASTFRTADNSAVASRSGAVNVPAQTAAARVGGQRSIGGFGATAASFESAGG
jgi:uncharacterized protein YgiB involved in biofilm formation